MSNTEESGKMEKEERIVDAQGLSCPEPALLTENALTQYGGSRFCVDVSSPAARDNVTALLAKRGRAVRVEDRAGFWRIHAEGS
jgi:TusA-related sulfurtransferase